MRHLFRVVASLDSMVVGEAQILGQVKEAYEHAFDNGATGRVFNKLFRQSFEVGKRVRTETDDRRVGRLDQLRGRRARQEGLRHARGPHDPRRRRRQDERADGEAPRLQRRALACSSRTARTSARSSWPSGSRARRSATTTCSTRMRDADIVISSTAAHALRDRARSRSRRSMKGRQRPPAVPHRHRRAARHRPGGQRALRRVPLRHRRPQRRRGVQPRGAHARGAPRRGHHRRGDRARSRRWLESMEVVPTIAAIRAKAEPIRAGRAREGAQAPRRAVGEGAQDGRGAHRGDREQDAARPDGAPARRSPARRTATRTSRPRGTCTGSTEAEDKAHARPEAARACSARRTEKPHEEGDGREPWR